VCDELPLPAQERYALRSFCRKPAGLQYRFSALEEVGMVGQELWLCE
jgi:hypothetical protein